VTGIVLGILALLGVVPLTLLATSVLVYGAAFLLSASWTSPATIPATGYQAGEAPFLGSSGHLLVGLSAAVLGILAIIGQAPLTLTLVGLLCLGTGAFFSGSSVGTRAVSFAQK
jgi:hypothetical protein